MSIPADATFRRAEGLTFLLDACVGFRHAQVIASRQGGDTRCRVTMEEVRLLSRMSAWARSDELGVPLPALISLVERNCAFWSRGRPVRVLSGELLDPLSGKVALRENVFPSPLLDTGKKQFAPFPTMARRGSLDGCSIKGTQFQIAEMELMVGAAAFVCCARHAQTMRELVLLLDGSHTVEELATDADKKALLEALAALGLLDRYTPRCWDGTAQITWLGHAGVLYEASGKRIIIDPAAFPRSVPTRFLVHPFDLRDLGTLDAVLITHGDNDHFQPAALARVARSTPIVIPRATTPRPYHVDMRRVLDLLGFQRIIEADEWQRIPVGDVTITATPFRGEDWGLDLPCRTYVVHGQELTIFANADSTSTPEVYDRIAQEVKVDIAFLGVTGAAESHAMPPGFGYGNFYVQWIAQEKHNEWVELCNGPREAAEAARRLHARYAVGYAAGGGDFYPLQYSDRGDHQALARCLAELAVATKPLALELGVPRRVADLA